MVTINAKKLTSFLSALLLIIGATGLSACATIEGAGEDIQSAGEAIEEGAEEAGN